MSKAILKKGLGLKVVALAAVVAAVALFGVVFTQSAAAAGPGDTVDVPADNGVTVSPFTTGDGIASFAIDEASTARGSFVANGGQSITCPDGAKCDVDDDANEVQVKLAIDAGSPDGFILVNIDDLNGTTNDTARRIDVDTDEQVVAISATTATPNPAIDADGTDTVAINARLTNPSDGGVNTKPVVVFTTLGLLDGCGGQDNVQACTENSADGDHDFDANTAAEAGVVSVTLKATDRAGVATVTFTAGDLSDSVDVVFYGDADSVTAEVMQSSIEIGGDTFIVLTATDSGGNPVRGYGANDARDALATDFTFQRAQGPDGGDANNNGVVGPTDKSVEVILGVLAVTNAMDFIHPTDAKQDIQSCVNAPETRDNPRTEAVETDFGVSTEFGTNAAGKCVIHVTAPSDDDNPDNNATRGTHTVHITGPEADRSKDVSVAIQVGGLPSQISSDAPANVDPLSSTEVTVTVVDDEGVPVGEVATSVNQIEGAGRVIVGQGDSMTSDGVVKFTYLAPQTPGTAVFRVTAGEGAGEIAASVVITIGEPVTEPPAAPASVSLVLTEDGLLIIAPAAPEGATAEQQLRAGNGAWMDAADVTAEAGMTYSARVRFVEGDLSSAWAYSNTVTVPVPEPEPEPEPEPQGISLTLRAGGHFYAVGDGVSTTASALFGDNADITSAWKWSPDAGQWLPYIPGINRDFSINTGDVLYVASAIDQTVGG